ncbi:hypothetical protein I4F81_003599 [Pyropia yezoensis]|uniref:Uncharacterized protein n=1 Tax=Pyropia yezoensis TaxID=2788 RepID=A0ACC3BSR0_PYRYE|nr:hypothetical protein I4F81_003599 [Neopyropia yezoensis]
MGGGGVPPDVAAGLPPNVTVHSPRMRSPYGVHHSKVCVFFYGDAGVRLVVSTANLSPADWGGMLQGVYCRDFPRRLDAGGQRRGGGGGGGPTSAAVRPADGASANPFGADLARYLTALGPPAVPYARMLAAYDLSSAGVDLVTSVPGSHTGVAMATVGHLRLRQLLAAAAPPPGAPRAVVQVSSIGGLSPAWVAQFGASLLPPLYR